MADDRINRSLRLPVALSEELQIVARVDNMSGNDLITEAVRRYLKHRRGSDSFLRRLEEQHADEWEKLDRYQ